MLRTLLIVGLILCAASFAVAQTTQQALSMSVAPTGAISLTLGKKVVADGRWQISDPIVAPDPGEVVAGHIVSTTAKIDSTTHAVIVDNYSAARVTYDLSLQQEDLHISMHADNLDPQHSLEHLEFNGITFHFSRPPTGYLHSNSNANLVQNASAMFHPSIDTQLGAAFAGDDDFAFSVFSPSEFDRVALFNAIGVYDGNIPAQCMPCFYTTRHIPAGKACDIDVVFRLSADRSIPHLLGGYKKLYDTHFPSLLYKPDGRAVAQFADVGGNLVTRQNPLGYNGAFRRLDSDAGTRAYIRSVAPEMKRAGMLGIIFWSPGGYDPPMYPPDFDVFPESVARNIPTLVAGFKKYGLRVGLCARCGDGVTREPGKDPIVYRLRSDNAEQMQTLANRFRHAMDMGFDLFYLDSFGGQNPDDVEILKKVRATVGPNVQLYTENATDMTLPYANRYCEWREQGILGSVPVGNESLRFLCPDAIWLCIDRTHRHRLPDYIKAGLTPLIGDLDASRMPASRPIIEP